MINIAMFFLLLALLAWAVTMTVLCFTRDCKQNNSDKPLEMNDAILSMPNCSNTREWAKCMSGQGTVKGCMPLHKGLMPKGNTEEGCWVKDDKDDNDPCMYFLEGGPSPNMAPTDCSTVCCTGGHHDKNEKTLV